MADASGGQERGLGGPKRGLDPPRRPAVRAVVLLDGVRHVVTAGNPLVFGRASVDGVVGLDPSDMGISATAGRVESEWGLWWVTNLSRKRRLLIDSPTGGAAQPLGCGERLALNRADTLVLVPGAVYTHRVEVHLPAEAVAAVRIDANETSGTITPGDVRLSDKDLTVLASMLAGYLRVFPRRDPHPRSYADVAAELGDPWTQVRVRKQVERVKERLSANGLFFTGPRANDELADYLLTEQLLVPDDLLRLPNA